MRRRDIKRKRISIPINIQEFDLTEYLDMSKYGIYSIHIYGYRDKDGKDRKIPFGDSIYSSDDAVVSGKSTTMYLFSNSKSGKPAITQYVFDIGVWWHKGKIIIEPTWKSGPVDIKNLNIIILYYKDKKKERNKSCKRQ